MRSFLRREKRFLLQIYGRGAIYKFNVLQNFPSKKIILANIIEKREDRKFFSLHEKQRLVLKFKLERAHI